jgi:sulfoxide reductase heme-binding subunit YedZ
MPVPSLNPSRKQIVILKVIAWLGCLEPALMLVYLGLNSAQGASPDLGANPVETVTLSTGTTTLVLILVTLAVTPVRRITGWNFLIRFRRLLGLFAFFYGCLHFTTYLWLDQNFSLQSMLTDVYKRPFITAGFFAFILMVPLAITSTNWSIRKLGGKKWSQLHSLIYVSGISAVIHFWWKVKADHREPALYGSILTVLLVYRLARWAKEQQVAPTAASPASGPADSG